MQGDTRRAAVTLFAAIALLIACAAPGASIQPSTAPTGSATTGSAQPPATAAVSASAAASPPASAGGDGTFTNPVIDADFPDPFVAQFDGTYYAYATGSAGKSIQFATSTDLVTWSVPAEALGPYPGWMTTATWAPEVYETSSGYVMYYSGRSNLEGPDDVSPHCLSSAVADTPTGPFLDESDEPLVCQPDLGGSIDPTMFTAEDGTRYLIWKNDGNCCGMPTRLWMQELNEHGLELVAGEPIDLGVESDVAWERGRIEAPTLLAHDGTYYLFYSGNWYETSKYAVGYATSDTVTGPYVDAEENPILTTAPPPAVAAGPGHQSIFLDDDGELWMAYHAWDVSAQGYELGGRRALWIDPLTFDGGKPDVLGPNPSPQPVP